MPRMYMFLGHYMHHDRRADACVAIEVMTDFAAHTSEAMTFADTLAMVACGAQVNRWDDLAPQAWPHGGTCESARATLAATLGEIVNVREVWSLSYR